MAEDTFGAIVAALDFSRRSGRKTSMVGFWFGAMHLVEFIIGTTVIVYPLAVASPGSRRSYSGVCCASSSWYTSPSRTGCTVARPRGYLTIVEWDRSSLRETRGCASGDRTALDAASATCGPGGELGRRARCFPRVHEAWPMRIVTSR